MANLADQPPALVYAVIAVLSFLENWIPPLPADAAIVLGAFISHESPVTAVGVYLATWLPNVAGAMTVWAVSRQYGRRFFASKLGHRLFSERALHFVEMEYRRFGSVGLCIVRFLPGVRAIAAPFAGMADVSFMRALLPMTIASGLWYGGLIFLGQWAGREWDAVKAWLDGKEVPLIALGAVIVGVVGWIIVRRRMRAAAADGAGHD